MQSKETHLITVLPNQVEMMVPSAFRLNTTENVSLSLPGVRLQSVSERSWGSIGTAFCTR